MPNILQLTDPHVRAALRHPALAGKKRIGRGAFCAVYDNGDTVLKLTADAFQYRFYAEPHWFDDSPYFPRLVHDFEDVGETADGLSLFLVEMEKLDRVSTLPACRRQVRQILKVADEFYYPHFDRAHKIRNQHERRKMVCIQTLDDMSVDERLEPGLQDALDRTRNFLSNHDCAFDLHQANFMRRGEQVVLNDVVADLETYERKNR